MNPFKSLNLKLDRKLFLKLKLNKETSVSWYNSVMTNALLKNKPVILLAKYGLALTFLFSTPMAFSQVVKQFKDNRVLVEFPAGYAIAKDDEFFVLNDKNKRSALIKITNVKGNRATGSVVKGNVVIGNTIQPRKATATQNMKGTEPAAAAAAPSFLRFDRMKLGFNFKYMMNAISAKQTDGTNTETVAMKGSNFGLTSNFDMPLSGRLIARGEAGVEMLDVKGTGQFNSCNGRTSKDCDAKITYLTLGAAGRYDLMQSKFTLFVAGGGLIKIPLSKASTSLDESKIEMANSIYGAFGGDFMLNNRSYFPVSLEYHLSLNKSDTVPVIDQINLTFGYGLIF